MRLDEAVKRLEAQLDALDARLLELSTPPPRENYREHPVIVARREAVMARLRRDSALRSRGRRPVYAGNETHGQALARMLREVETPQGAKAWIEKAKKHTLEAREYVRRRLERVRDGDGS